MSFFFTAKTSCTLSYASFLSRLFELLPNYFSFIRFLCDDSLRGPFTCLVAGIRIRIVRGFGLDGSWCSRMSSLKVKQILQSPKCTALRQTLINPVRRKCNTPPPYRGFLILISLDRGIRRDVNARKFKGCG